MVPSRGLERVGKLLSAQARLLGSFAPSCRSFRTIYDVSMSRHSASDSIATDRSPITEVLGLAGRFLRS